MTTSDGTDGLAADSAGIGRAQRVLSPEQVGLDLPLAGPGPRILAYGIDYLLILALQLILFFLVLLVLVAESQTNEGGLLNELFSPWQEDFEAIGEERASPEVLQSFVAFVIGVMLLFQVLAEWVYFISAEMLSGGSSVGKRVLKLRVVRSGGLPLTFRTSLTRNVLRIVDILPGQYLVGLTSMVLSDESRRLGDYAADTVVVRLDRATAAPEIEPLSPEEHGLITLDPAMRAQIGPSDLKLARATLRRQRELDEDLAERTLQRAVDVLRGKIGYEAEVPPSQRRLFLRTVIDCATRR